MDRLYASSNAVKCWGHKSNLDRASGLKLSSSQGTNSTRRKKRAASWRGPLPMTGPGLTANRAHFSAIVTNIFSVLHYHLTGAPLSRRARTLQADGQTLSGIRDLLTPNTSSDGNSDLLGEVLWRSPLFLSSHTQVLVLVPPRAIRKQKNKMVPLYLIMWL